MTTLFDLYPGQVVTVGWGSGLVPTAETTIEVIAFAAENYAITTTGVLLTETDRRNVTLQQETKPVGFYISAKARRLQEVLLLPLEEPYPDAEKLSRGLEDGFEPQYNPLF